MHIRPGFVDEQRLEKAMNQNSLNRAFDQLAKASFEFTALLAQCEPM